MPFLERFRHRSQKSREHQLFLDFLELPLTERTEQLLDKLLEDLKHGFRAEFTPKEDEDWAYGAEPPAIVDFMVGLRYQSTYFTVEYDGDPIGYSEITATRYDQIQDINFLGAGPKMIFSNSSHANESEKYAPTLFRNTERTTKEKNAADADNMMTQLCLAKVDPAATQILFDKANQLEYFDTIRYPRYRPT